MTQEKYTCQTLFSHVYCFTLSTLLSLGLTGSGCVFKEKRADPWDKKQFLLPLEERIQRSVSGKLEYCTQNCNDKQQKVLLPYDKSLQRLRSSGYDRHLHAHEAFDLFFSNLEHVLVDDSSDPYADNCRKINTYSAGWLSLAFERQKSVLVAYVDPEDLVWNGTSYTKGQNFRCSERKEFSILWNISHQPTYLDQLESELVQFLCKRPVKQIPSWLEKTNCSLYVWLPEDGEIWPMAFSIGKDVCVKGVDVAISRGVVSRVHSLSACPHEKLSKEQTTKK